MTDEELFEVVLEAAPEDRPLLLDALCANRPDLRTKIEALLRDLEVGRSSEPPVVPRGPQTGALLAGRYALVEKLGEGGMGEVWVAKQSEPVKRKVAAKLIKKGMDSRWVLARFEQERQALALMDHPNIAKVLDGGLTRDGRPFFVMELVAGTPLTKFCDENRLGVRERLELFAQVCRAVQHAHQKGIIHRDLKPANVLATVVDGRPVPKVIDFGVAKAVSGKLTDDTLSTHFGTVLGTLEYMAPEQAGSASDDIDTRADIYSLGVILYELLTGLRPFDSRRLKRAAFDEVVRLIREEEPPSLSSRLSGDESLPSVAAVRGVEPKRLVSMLKGELDWIVLRCLEKDRNRRYESASGLGRDVERFLADEPVEARPTGLGYRLKKFVRRHRLAASAAAAIAAALVIGVVGLATGLAAANTAWTAEALRAEGERQAKHTAEARRIEAEASRQRAEEETQIAQAVRRFLQHKLLGQADVQTQADALLAAGRSSSEAKRDPTIRELLDRASEELTEAKIEENFPKQPVLQAELLETVGNAYRGVGDFAKAIEFLSRSAELRKAHQGADVRATLNTLSNLAAAHLSAGRAAEAVALLEAVKRTPSKESDDVDRANTLNSLATANWAQGKLEAAITLLDEAATLQTKSLGAEHPETLVTLSNLAEGYRSAGRVAEAVPLFERLRDAQIKKRGPEHPSTLMTLHGLAAAYAQTGRLTDAIRLLEKVRDGQSKKLGPDHPDTLITATSLANAYAVAGRAADALPLLERARDAHAQKHGPGHPITLVATLNLAAAHQRAGKTDRALALFEEAAAGVEKRGFQHQEAEGIILATAHALEAAGRFGKAEAWLRKWREAVARARGRTSVAYSTALDALGGNLLAQQKWVDAESVLREALAIRNADRADWRRWLTQTMLGSALAGAKKYAEAEPLLVGAYEGLRVAEPSLPSQAAAYIPNTLEWLIQLHAAMKKPDLVKKWRDELAKRRQLPAKPAGGKG